MYFPPLSIYQFLRRLNVYAWRARAIAKYCGTLPYGEREKTALVMARALCPESTAYRP